LEEGRITMDTLQVIAVLLALPCAILAAIKLIEQVKRR